MSANRIQYPLALAFVISLVVLTGCAHQYMLKTDNGDQIIAGSKPQLQGNQYYFKDEAGGDHVIPKSRVVKIKAVSVVRDQGPPAQKPPPSPIPPKPKHWYLLWLA